MISVGLLVQDDDVGVTIVQSGDKKRGRGRLIGDGLFIPRANIQAVEELIPSEEA